MCRHVRADGEQVAEEAAQQLADDLAEHRDRARRVPGAPQPLRLLRLALHLHLPGD